ncbi:MAG: hypothetical protein JO187_03025 [Acidobacteria bacterium]|nr:hypothetical protein [Acidobacteriota bacterium]
MWWVLGLVGLVGLPLGTLAARFAYKADFEQFLDLVSVLRECVRNYLHDAKLPSQPAAAPMKASVTGAVAKTL